MNENAHTEAKGTIWERELVKYDVSGGLDHDKDGRSRIGQEVEMKETSDQARQIPHANCMFSSLDECITHAAKRVSNNFRSEIFTTTRFYSNADCQPIKSIIAFLRLSAA
jgi:hypothetical protein